MVVNTKHLLWFHLDMISLCLVNKCRKTLTPLKTFGFRWDPPAQTYMDLDIAVLDHVWNK